MERIDYKLRKTKELRTALDIVKTEMIGKCFISVSKQNEYSTYFRLDDCLEYEGYVIAKGIIFGRFSSYGTFNDNDKLKFSYSDNSEIVIWSDGTHSKPGLLTFKTFDEITIDDFQSKAIELFMDYFDKEICN